MNPAKIILWILPAAFISCFVAFHNHFPLVYQDTASYIHTGFSRIVLDDRPSAYGLWIRLSSMHYSLWSVVFFQSLLVCYLIFQLFSAFYQGSKLLLVFGSSIVFLTFFTAFSFTVSVLIPDIFSSIALLCLMNMLVHKQPTRFDRYFLPVLFIASASMHYSSLPILLLMLCAMLVLKILKKNKSTMEFPSWKKIVYLFSLCMLTLVCIPFSHYVIAGKFKYSGSTHVFLMNHFVETGILANYLDEKCSDHNYRICAYKDSLVWDFMWDPRSAVNQTGGWAANREEYNRIILDILSTPKYLGITIKKGVESSFRQFFSINASVAPAQIGNSEVIRQIRWRFPDSETDYLSSLQSQSKLKTSLLNSLQPFIVLPSLLLLLLLISIPSLNRTIEEREKLLILLIVLYSLINAVVCSNLSTIHDRFQSRIAWLWPLLCILIVARNWNDLRKSVFKSQ